MIDSKGTQNRLAETIRCALPYPYPRRGLSNQTFGRMCEADLRVYTGSRLS